jgi:hypothetical protein
MITQVVHEVTGAVEPAGVSLALAVANELHAPVPRRPRPRARIERAPEVAIPQVGVAVPKIAVPQIAVPQLMGLRRTTTTARPHRRKIPLNRLTAVMG